MNQRHSSPRSRQLLAGLVTLAALTATATAQTFTAEADCGRAGEVFFTDEVTGALDAKANPQVVHLLNPAFTGAGYRWDVSYTMTRTKFDWPWWRAYARIDVLSADGQSLGRTWTRSFKGTVEGTFSFHGEEHAEARPHRIRISFSQPITFPYMFNLRLAARPVAGANYGGASLETPEPMAIGTAEAPNFTCGDIVLTNTPHRFSLFQLRPGQSLSARLHAGNLSSSYGHFGFTVHDLNHDVIARRDVLVRKGQWHTAPVYRNESDVSRWIVLGIGSRWGLDDHRIGFFSADGAWPAAGETVKLPSASELSPFSTADRSYQEQELPRNGKTVFELPASGERTHLKIQIAKGFLTSAPGVFTAVEVFAASGKLLKRAHAATPPWGHEPAEITLDFSGSSTDEVPARVQLSTRYNACTVSVDCTRLVRD